MDDDEKTTDLDEVLDRGDEFESEEDTEEQDVQEDSEVEQESEETEDESEEEGDDEVSIPKYRLDEVIAQREAERERTKWLEEQLAKLIGTKQEVKDKMEEVKYDFEGAEERYANFILEGEASKAAKLRAEIDTARRNELLALINQAKDDATKEATTKTEANLAEKEFKSTIVRLETQHPFLDANSKKYNEEAVDTVNTLMRGYVAAGIPKAEALEKAVKKVVPFYKEETQVPKKLTLGDSRKVEANKKAAKASNAQPPKVPAKTVETFDASAVKVSKMSDSDFRKLSAAEKRQLRGD